MRAPTIPYSPEELAWIKDHAALPRREARVLFCKRFRRRDVSLNNFRNLCTRNGWAFGRKPWRRVDEALLRKLYPNLSTAKVAQRLGRSLSAVYGHARLLDLSKSEDYLASPDACRLRRGDNVGAAYRFPKGHVPANKGLRRPGYSAGRMKETWFRKGQAGHNWMPIGGERVVDGYRYTKVSDIRRVPWTVNWRPTHVLRWTATNGPIPDGHCLKSLDGNRLNTDPSNWALISRGALPFLNGHRGPHYDQAPPDVKPAILTLAKLKHARFSKTTAKEMR
jgi:HNH endonuclease